jgi:hypothetical protein
VAKKFPQEVFLHVGDLDAVEDEQWWAVDEKPEHFAEVNKKLLAGRYKLVETVEVTAKTSISVRKSARRKA